ncbi:helix-turn-helix transcriptional regulator [Acinetobacter baumannii]|nr:helix-turn-helix transcriptional regulator [Acinetobacter baumannii]EHU2483439.1 helix-turn-helix transcriptional regulator [Acinetobacter baumannii]MDA4941849.1 helix-turn-helix transcriptional regulator [Acinetobacter baumannii]MDH2489290.1 helix-turn-helix transcriptional regulator [Acinetobacter baumannii]MDV7434302.1 helix-turn-helix transcriptional regulator [Acinetobacter baumannii]
MRSIHNPAYQALIKEIVSYRKSKNMTQVELASKLDKPQQYVAKVENLDRRIDAIELKQWLKALNADRDFMIKILVD